MRQAAISPSFAKTSCNSIHLVKGTRTAGEAFAASSNTSSVHALPWDRQRRFSEAAATLAFAGVALVVPVAWLGHAVLVRLKLL